MILEKFYLQKNYFDRCTHEINPHEGHQRKIQIGDNVENHPSLKDTEQIFQLDPMIDYE